MQDSTNDTLESSAHAGPQDLEMGKPNPIAAPLRRRQRHAKIPTPNDIDDENDDADPSWKKRKRAATWHEKYNHNREKALYGDMINTAVGCIVNVFYGRELYGMPPMHPRYQTAAWAFGASVAPLIFYFPAVLTKNLWLSRLGMASVVLGLSYMCLVEWPYEGECAIKEMMMGQVLMAVLSNVSLGFYEKLARLAYVFGVASFVSLRSPHSDYWNDTLPVLGGCVLGSVFGLWVYHFDVSRKLATIWVSKLVLAVVALGFATSFSSSFVAYGNLSSAVYIVGVACLLALATGSIHQEVRHGEKLERMVSARTREIQAQNNHLRMVGMALQASETAVAITDNKGTIVWTNAAFRGLCGCPDAEERLKGTTLLDTIYDLDRTRKENRYILFTLFEDASAKSEDELRIKDSIYRLEATPFAGSSGSSKTGKGDTATTANDRFLVAFKDVTPDRARAIAEKEAREKAMAAKAMGDAMVTLTHELRTPLQGIMGVTSLLLQRAAVSDSSSSSSSSSSSATATTTNITTKAQPSHDKDSHESLKLIMASSGLLLNLINNLLDIKKVSANMMKDFHMTPIVASGPIRDAVGFCQPLASISGVEIVVSEDELARHAVVRSNPIRLQQVLINLVSNAIKYTKPGSKIIVSAKASTLAQAERSAENALASSQGHAATARSSSPEAPVLVFSVSDRGPGIPPGQADRLFARFAQLEIEPRRILGATEVGQPSGTGLGLNLCQEFVERMNGRIWATNNNTGAGAAATGASFSFCLPLIKGGVGEDRPPRPTAKLSSQPNVPELGALANHNEAPNLPSRQRRVLLVDDTLINRKVFRRMLQEIGVSDLVAVESGEKALEELSARRYDLVITDLNMPGMQGTELSRRINKRHEPQPPLVIGLTADSVAGELAERCTASGMADVLSKPITLKELKDYFETTLPKLEAGVRAGGDTHTPAQ